jgi:hypothetical protein
LLYLLVGFGFNGGGSLPGFGNKGLRFAEQGSGLSLCGGDNALGLFAGLC